MDPKIIFFVVASMLFVQGVYGSRDKRDAPAETADNKQNPLEDLTKNINTFFQDNLKVDKVWESITTNLKTFGEKVQTGAKDLAKTIQQGSDDIFKSKKDESKN